MKFQIARCTGFNGGIFQISPIGSLLAASGIHAISQNGEKISWYFSPSLGLMPGDANLMVLEKKKSILTISVVFGSFVA